MHILLEKLFQLVESTTADSDPQQISLQYIVQGLKKLETANTTIVRDVLKNITTEPATSNLDDSIPTINTVNLQSSQTALMMATQLKRRRCVQTLLQAGAKPNIQDSAGRTALWTAIRHEEEACVQLLLQAGANINLVDKKNLTVLDEAIQEENLSVMCFALAYDAEIRNIEKCRRLLYDKLHDTLFQYATNNHLNIHRLYFCRGVLHEKLGDIDEAENYYRLSSNCPGAYRKRGDIFKSRGNLLAAIYNYSAASQAGDPFAPSRLVALMAHHENLSQNEIDNSKNYSLITAYLRSSLASLPLSAQLSSQEWRQVALHTFAYNEQKSFPLTTHQKAFNFIRRAETTATTEEDKEEAHSIRLRLHGFFRNMMEPGRLKDIAREGREQAAEIIADYCGDEAMITLVVEALNPSRRH